MYTCTSSYQLHLLTYPWSLWTNCPLFSFITISAIGTRFSITARWSNWPRRTYRPIISLISRSSRCTFRSWDARSTSWTLWSRWARLTWWSRWSIKTNTSWGPLQNEQKYKLLKQIIEYPHTLSPLVPFIPWSPGGPSAPSVPCPPTVPGIP